MSPAQLEKRLAEVETYLAKRWPAPAPGHPEWFAWVTDDELTELDLMTTRWDAEGAEPTEIDLRLAEVELAATRRTLSGAPSERDRDRGYGPARP